MATSKRTNRKAREKRTVTGPRQVTPKLPAEVSSLFLPVPNWDEHRKAERERDTEFAYDNLSASVGLPTKFTESERAEHRLWKTLTETQKADFVLVTVAHATRNFQTAELRAKELKIASMKGQLSAYKKTAAIIDGKVIEIKELKVEIAKLAKHAIRGINLWIGQAKRRREYLRKRAIVWAKFIPWMNDYFQRTGNKHHSLADARRSCAAQFGVDFSTIKRHTKGYRKSPLK